MSSSINPVSSLCFGVINTDTIILGIQNGAIKIDNTKTPAEISINGVVYFPTPGAAFKDFTNLIPLEGFNPTGTLYIGNSNTSNVELGLLKIDNATVPPQIFLTSVATVPIISPVDTNSYAHYLTSNVIGNKDTLQKNINSFTAIYPINKVVSLGKNRNDFLLIDGGGYEIEFNVEGSLLLSVYLVVKNRNSILDFSTGLYLEEYSEIPQSNITLTAAETSKTIKFNIYTKTPKTIIYFGTNSLTDITLKPGSYIKIKHLAYIVEIPVPPIDSTPHLYKLKSNITATSNSIRYTIQFNNEDNNGTVTVNTFDTGQNNILTLVEGGQYEFNIKIKIQNTDSEESIQGPTRTQSVYLIPKNNSILTVSGSRISIGSPIESSENPLYNSRLDFNIGSNSVGTFYQGEIIKCIIYAQPGGTLSIGTDSRNYSNSITYPASITFIQADTVISIKHISRVVPSNNK
jgi:hypothetical protein